MSCCAALAGSDETTGSRGAVSVIGGGAARSCYQAARFKGVDSAGVKTCSDALDSGALTSDDRAATFINRGILRERLSKYQDALSDYDAGLTVRPNLAEAYIDRGAVLIKMGRYAEAIADLSKGIALGSESAQIAYFDRGQAREVTDDLDGACADYRQALVLQPDFEAARHRADICNIQPKRKPS